MTSESKALKSIFFGQVSTMRSYLSVASVHADRVNSTRLSLSKPGKYLRSFPSRPNPVSHLFYSLLATSCTCVTLSLLASYM